LFLMAISLGKMEAHLLFIFHDAIDYENNTIIAWRSRVS
jgi:hypothetical protein